MVTDAAWADMNGDQQQDLIIVGEWMPVTVFLNSGGKLANKTDEVLGKSYSGWWNRLVVADINGDQKPDIIAGNEGLNTQCKVSETEPAELYYKDFDNNGSNDPS